MISWISTFLLIAPCVAAEPVPVADLPPADTVADDRERATSDEDEDDYAEPEPASWPLGERRELATVGDAPVIERTHRRCAERRAGLATTIDRAFTAIPSAGGGFVLAGTSRAEGDDQILVVDVSASGEFSRPHRVDPGPKYDEPVSLLPRTGREAGLVLATITWRDEPGMANYGLSALDEAGALQWERVYGSERRDWLRAAFQVGKTVVLAGHSEARDGAWLVEVDEAGKVRRESVLKGVSVSVAVRVADQIWLVSRAKDPETNKWATRVVQADRKLRQQGSFDLPTIDLMTPRGGRELADGTIALFGQARPHDGRGLHAAIAFVSPQGDLRGIWQAAFPEYSTVNAIQELPGGDLLVVGIRSPGGDTKIQGFSARISRDGQTRWDRLYGPTSTFGEVAVARPIAVRPTDGGFLVVGSVATGDPEDLWSMRIDPDGHQICETAR